MNKHKNIMWRNINFFPEYCGMETMEEYIKIKICKSCCDLLHSN